MSSFFDSISARVVDSGKRKRDNARGKIFHCDCGQPVFFHNTLCLASQTQLGYEPDLGEVRSLAEGPEPDTWVLASNPKGRIFKRCGNLNTPAACNWLLPADSAETLCLACQLNRTIPDLLVPENSELWRKIEAAKRLLIAQLLTLGLPVRPMVEEGDGGLAFDFLGTSADGVAPLTGHASGLVTLNIKEADDAERARMREQMHEPYRTLLGHFRHEIGHYYWDVLIANGPFLEHFRKAFGDERIDYGEALKVHYENGAPPDWANHFISTYASSHPWEDWAETWAHYLHMMDTVDTALSFGISPKAVQRDYEPFTEAVLTDPDDPSAQDFLRIVNAWVALTGVLNELSRAMGQRDFYPFALPAPVVGKLQFIHRVVKAGSEQVSRDETVAVTIDEPTLMAGAAALQNQQTQEQGDAGQSQGDGMGNNQGQNLGPSSTPEGAPAVDAGGATAPADNTVAPVGNTVAPADSNVVPVNNTVAPVNNGGQPDNTVAPLNNNVAPANNNVAPVNNPAPTVNGVNADGAPANPTSPPQAAQQPVPAPL
jgi:hypothetical protein